MQEPFFRPLWHGSAPLVIWAVHFFAAYAVVAAGCGTALQPFLRTGLLVAGAVAIAAIGWLLLRQRGRTGLHRLRGAALIGGGVLACLGIAWTTLPLLLVPVCASAR